MKHHVKPHKNRENEETGDFGLRIMIAAAAAVLILCVGKINPEAADAIERSVDSGLTYAEVIELLGRGISSRDAVNRLWQEGVVEVWEELKN